MKPLWFWLLSSDANDRKFGWSHQANCLYHISRAQQQSRENEIGYSRHWRASQYLGNVLEEEKALEAAPRRFLARRFKLLNTGNAIEANDLTVPSLCA